MGSLLPFLLFTQLKKTTKVKKITCQITIKLFIFMNKKNNENVSNNSGVSYLSIC